MSVIVRNEEGKILNFIKGADMTIIPLVEGLDDQNDNFLINSTDEFAELGLRTLMFAKKDLDGVS